MLFIQPDFQFEPLLLFDINLGSRVLELHIQIVKHWCWLRYFSYHLEFKGSILEESQQLTQYHIKDQSVIHLRVLSPDAQAPPSKHQGSHIALEKSHEVDLDCSFIHLSGFGLVTLQIQPEFQEKPLMVDINLWSSVSKLKRSLIHHWSLLGHSRFYLKFEERILEDHQRLRNYGIEDQSVIHIIIARDSDQMPPAKCQSKHNLSNKSDEGITMQDPPHQQG